MDAAARHDNVDVWMKIEFAAVGVKHRGESGGSAEMSPVCRHGVDGLFGGLKHQTVCQSLILIDDRPEFKGDNKCNEVVSFRNQFLLLSFKPCDSAVMMTLGATATAAGVWRVMHLTTDGTFENNVSQS